MMRLMRTTVRCGVVAVLLTALLAGCGSGSAAPAESASDGVPAATVARFDAEADNHGSVVSSRGCVTETSGERLAVEQERQKAKGTPVVNRPGSDGGTEATGEWASASTEEVPRRAA